MSKIARVTSVVVAAVSVVLSPLPGCAGEEGLSRPTSQAPVQPGAAEPPAPTTPPPAQASARPRRSRRGADATFRAASPRRAETIFSPLELPAPNQYRAGSGAPGHDYWQQQVDYVIEASLDEKTLEVTGSEKITYTNNSPDRLEYLWIHLEQNVFRPDSHGSLMRENEGRFGNRNPFSGGVRISSCKIAGRDTPIAIYDTIGRIDLPAPVAAKGGRVEVEISWTFAVPTHGADRMGIFDSETGPVFEVAQWFPAVAVYDDVHGWNTLPYLGQGEFYTNFGDFDVSLTVPRSHIVAATGELQNPEEVLTATQQNRLTDAMASAGTVVIRGAEEVNDPSSRPPGDAPLTWRFKSRSTRTFAWASSAAYLWDGAHIDWGDGTGVLVQSVYPPEAQPLWGDKSTQMLKFAIEHYSKKWFRYPYPVATNVNGIVGGMEYPMIIFCSERKDERGLFGVTSHEIGHNWFPMTVNTDERRHAWMDEGFDSFINVYAEQEYYPDPARTRRAGRDAAGGMQAANRQPIAMPADQILPWALGTLQYGKTASGLLILREYILGPERFDAAFRHYIKAWAFKSPQPADFFRCMEDASGMDLSWFWRGWFLETGTLDQAVESVTYPKDTTKVSVTFANNGELVMPLKYKVTYSDDTEEVRHAPVEAWFTHDRFVATWDVGLKRVTKVELDPDAMLPDTDLKNNVWEGD